MGNFAGSVACSDSRVLKTCVAFWTDTLLKCPYYASAVREEEEEREMERGGKGNELIGRGDTPYLSIEITC